MPNVNVESVLKETIEHAFTVGYTIRSLQQMELQVPDWLVNLPRNTLISHHFGVIGQNFPNLVASMPSCDCCDVHTNRRYPIHDEDDVIVHYCYDCRSTRAYYWDEDDEYHTTPESSDGYVGNYHSHNRDRLFAGLNMNDPSLLGLEIETYINDSGSRQRRAVQNSIGSHLIFAERDGSLSSQHGVEFIFAPVSYNDIVDGCFIHQWSEKLISYGVTEDLNNYGMHISLNIRPCDQLTVGKFCHFINTSPDLCITVAQRSSSDWAQFNTRSRVTDYNDLTSKYMAASRRSRDRVEVRIFKSTVQWPLIKKNCQFVESVRNFTRDTDVSNLTEREFCTYLLKDDVRPKYPELISFLKANLRTQSKSIFA